jgi:hypothetical protein
MSIRAHRPGKGDAFLSPKRHNPMPPAKSPAGEMLNEVGHARLPQEAPLSRLRSAPTVGADESMLQPYRRMGRATIRQHRELDLSRCPSGTGIVQIPFFKAVAQHSKDCHNFHNFTELAIRNSGLLTPRGRDGSGAEGLFAASINEFNTEWPPAQSRKNSALGQSHTSDSGVMSRETEPRNSSIPNLPGFPILLPQRSLRLERQVRCR